MQMVMMSHALLLGDGQVAGGESQPGGLVEGRDHTGGGAASGSVQLDQLIVQGLEDLTGGLLDTGVSQRRDAAEEESELVQTFTHLR